MARTHTNLVHTHLTIKEKEKHSHCFGNELIKQQCAQCVQQIVFKALDRPQ